MFQANLVPTLQICRRCVNTTANVYANSVPVKKISRPKSSKLHSLNSKGAPVEQKPYYSLLVSIELTGTCLI